MQDSISAPQDGRNRADDRIYSPGNSRQWNLQVLFFWLLFSVGKWELEKDSGMHFSIRFRRSVMQVLI